MNGSIKQEIWSPKSSLEQHASSVVEVLTIIKESLDADILAHGMSILPAAK